MKIYSLQSISISMNFLFPLFRMENIRPNASDESEQKTKLEEKLEQKKIAYVNGSFEAQSERL